MITLELLRDVELFRDLAPAELAKILPLAREETYRKDDVVFRERDAADKLYVVLSGVVEIGRAGRDARPVRLVRLERGEAFGEMGLFDGGARSATAVAALVPETRVASFAAAARKLSMRLRATGDALFSVLRTLK
jgi:CRP-like cAMP-binding protein